MMIGSGIPSSHRRMPRPILSSHTDVCNPSRHHEALFPRKPWRLDQIRFEQSQAMPLSGATISLLKDADRRKGDMTVTGR
jgi:hypothetical protein